MHRDIKPENLLIDTRGRVKIADFGLAKMLRREPLDMTLPVSGMAVGTLRYMAPEQMDKPETVDHRADIYSLGVVFYELLTGVLPQGHFELPSQKASVDARLDQIVLHALERLPERRYQQAREVKTDIEHVTSTPRPAAASPAVAASAEPTASVSADQTIAQSRLSWLGPLSVLALGWLAIGAFWNLRILGTFKVRAWSRTKIGLPFAVSPLHWRNAINIFLPVDGPGVGGKRFRRGHCARPTDFPGEKGGAPGARGQHFHSAARRAQNFAA